MLITSSLPLWAAGCAEHVLHLFEREAPTDRPPRDTIEATRAWARGEMGMMQERTAGGDAMGAARPLREAARFAACAAGQAACVGHVPEHELGAAAYAIKAVQAREHPPLLERALADALARRLDRFGVGLG